MASTWTALWIERVKEFRFEKCLAPCEDVFLLCDDQTEDPGPRQGGGGGRGGGREWGVLAGGPGVVRVRIGAFGATLTLRM